MFTTHPACTDDEIINALRFVEENYVEAGLAQPSERGLYIIPQHYCSETRILIGKEDGEIITTCTVIPDFCTLPAEDVFYEELEHLRDDPEHVLVEVSCLASKGSLKHIVPFMEDVKGILIHESPYNLIVITIHPRHTRFYKKYFGFTEASTVKEYDRVLGNPAVLMYLVLDKPTSYIHTTHGLSPCVVLETFL